MSNVVDLGNGIYQVDVYDMGMPERTCAYVIKGDKVAIIETGPTPGIVRLLAGLNRLNIAPEEVDYVIVTHIHLDHSGGAGVLLKRLPAARLMVHPRGLRHLAEPSRLVAAVRVLYGEKFDDFFGEILPIEEERLYGPSDGEQLDLGKGHVLAFYHTLGHANHHMVIYDSLSQGLFSGDALGVLYCSLSRIIGREYIFPTTPPPDFDPQKGVATCDQVARLAPQCIYFSHFGRSFNVNAVLDRNREMLMKMTEVGRQVLKAGGLVEEVAQKLWELMKEEISGYGLGEDISSLKIMVGDAKLYAGGIVDYLSKEKKI